MTIMDITIHATFLPQATPDLYGTFARLQASGAEVV